MTLFEWRPLEEAMPRLIGGPLTPVSGEAEAAASSVEGSPAKRALAWLYVDDLERAHQICQDDHSVMGSLLHAIVHRREGDFGNARYWLMQAGSLASAESRALLDAVKRARGDEPELLERQREEWRTLWEKG